ncbi:hypothetical protein TNCV_337871 [Trichonephila clavipes]|nr:hypothetical protein TNCV_337871 [Trichonephila clavipes]
MKREPSRQCKVCCSKKHASGKKTSYPGKNNHLADSYSPISLLYTLSKIAEHVIVHRINTYKNENNYLNPNQYGFNRQLSNLPPTAQTQGKKFLQDSRETDPLELQDSTVHLLQSTLPSQKTPGLKLHPLPATYHPIRQHHLSIHPIRSIFHSIHVKPLIYPDSNTLQIWDGGSHCDPCFKDHKRLKR